jgi:hypothetical protein
MLAGVVGLERCWCLTCRKTVLLRARAATEPVFEEEQQAEVTRPLRAARAEELALIDAVMARVLESES